MVSAPWGLSLPSTARLQLPQQLAELPGGEHIGRTRVEALCHVHDETGARREGFAQLRHRRTADIDRLDLRRERGGGEGARRRRGPGRGEGEGWGQGRGRKGWGARERALLMRERFLMGERGAKSIEEEGGWAGGVGGKS